jgi:hypothetical protein
MVLTSRTLRLTINNSISGLCDVFDEQESPEIMADQMILKIITHFLALSMLAKLSLELSVIELSFQMSTSE